MTVPPTLRRSRRIRTRACLAAPLGLDIMGDVGFGPNTVHGTGRSGYHGPPGALATRPAF